MLLRYTLSPVHLLQPFPCDKHWRLNPSLVLSSTGSWEWASINMCPLHLHQEGCWCGGGSGCGWMTPELSVCWLLSLGPWCCDWLLDVGLASPCVVVWTGTAGLGDEMKRSDRARKMLPGMLWCFAIRASIALRTWKKKNNDISGKTSLIAGS